MRALLVAAGLLISQAAFVQSPEPAPWKAEDVSFTGWVRFTDGEFQLYPKEADVLRPFSRPCLSGVAGRDEMRQAVRDLGGQEVTITGRTEAWSRDLPGHRIEHDGSVVRNRCGGEFVVLADDITTAD